MAQVQYDPENERVVKASFGRHDMRSTDLRARQRRIQAAPLQVIRAEILATAETKVLAAEKVLQVAKAELAEAQEIVYRKRLRFYHSEIEKRACRLFGVTRSQINSNRRHKSLVFARQFVMYWTSRLTEHSYPVIGRLMGGRDHTTVLHGKNTYVDKRKAMGRHLRRAR